ncbi:hypothetical protein Sdel_2183 [Sulfurospirillum deleyianum DSM 6946]|uniref:Uncharacterized protein n=1 Tax=Sulfurospirillum deleyianum (strain ATCC 51133 / DSM 6946 / 5175) TaxID=525898 RepID=D1B525_SULD5|nr:hypothetical protein Sdel_2183 [Sulfurospirillum deleyianum DSM 6946]
MDNYIRSLDIRAIVSDNVKADGFRALCNYTQDLHLEA